MLLIGYLLLALVVAAVLFYLVVAFLPSGLEVAPVRDDRPLELPANRRMRMADLDRVRIPVSVRGYRFAETDELIDRLAAEIVVRDEEIARLKSQGYPIDADPELTGAGSTGAGLAGTGLTDPGSAGAGLAGTGPTGAGSAGAGAAQAVPVQREQPAEPEWAVRELGEQAAAEVAAFEAGRADVADEG